MILTLAAIGVPPASAKSAEAADQAAFEELFRTNSRAILAYALRRCPSEEDAADVLAEVMLTAWRRWAELPAGDDARLWLYGVARRVLANRARGERRQVRLADRLRSELIAELASHPEEVADTVATVRSAIAGLPESDREVLLLSAWEGLDPTQIAEVLEIRPVTARSRLHRARGRLREALEPEAPRLVADLGRPETEGSA